MSTRSSTPNSYAAAGPSSGPGAALGTIRSRTLLFLSYRDSVPRSSRSSFRAYPGTRQDAGDSGADLTGGSGKGKGRPGGAGGRRHGAYFDASGELHEEHAGLLNGSAADDPAHTAIEISSLPPKWVDISDEVDGILAGVKPKIAQLDRLHAKHVLPGFTDRSAEEREIDALTTGITRLLPQWLGAQWLGAPLRRGGLPRSWSPLFEALREKKEFRRASKLISTLAQHTNSLSSSGKASAREVAMAHNVQTALATRVQDLSGAFRKKQSVYMQRLKGHEIRNADLMAASGINRPMRDSETAVREDMELSRQQLASSASQSQSQALLLEEESAAPADAMISQRNHEINQIAKSIAELAELFQDLSALVIDQGTMLDRIDYNVETMGQDMHAAVEELDTATKYQRRTGKRQCILFLLLCIALLVAILIIKPFWRAFSAPSPSPANPAPPPDGASPLPPPAEAQIAGHLHLERWLAWPKQEEGGLVERMSDSMDERERRSRFGAKDSIASDRSRKRRLARDA